jgi:hypothetical protein
VQDRVVNRQTVGHVSTGRVDEQIDGPSALVGEFAHPLDDRSGVVLLDITDQIHVTKALRLFSFQRLLDRFYKLTDEPVREFTHTLTSLRTPRAGLT